MPPTAMRSSRAYLPRVLGRLELVAAILLAVRGTIGFAAKPCQAWLAVEAALDTPDRRGL
jgi:hypothetical protein